MVLFGCLFVGGVSSQVITSSLEVTDREYVCPGEIVTYVCTGSGSNISLYAPPQISSDRQISYFSSDAVGTGIIRDEILTNLFAINPFVVDLIVQDTSLTGLTISCSIESQDPVERTHVLSGTFILSCIFVSNTGIVQFNLF